MAVCEICHNEPEKPIKITIDGKSHMFDSFQCAIYALAPVCGCCGCRIIGRGIKAGSGLMFCCADCAKHDHVTVGG